MGTGSPSLHTTVALQEDIRHLYVTFLGSAGAPALQEIPNPPIAIATANRRPCRSCLVIIISFSVRLLNQVTSTRIPMLPAPQSKLLNGKNAIRFSPIQRSELRSRFRPGIGLLASFEK